MQRTRNRKLLIAVFTILALVLAAAVVAVRHTSDSAPAVRISQRAEPTTTTDGPHVEICPPYCPTTTSEAPTTTLPAPPPPTSPPLPPTTAAPAPLPEVVAPPAPAPVASGSRSYAWWEAIANCESGNTDAWRTGYYGLEGDHPYGGLSKQEQLTIAEGIYARYGDSAWGCAPVAWANVPSG